MEPNMTDAISPKFYNKYIYSPSLASHTDQYLVSLWL